MIKSQTPRHDYYHILNLPFTTPPAALSKQQLKIAYHKALLKHHPDKAISVAATPARTHTHDTKTAYRSSPDRNADTSPTFTIDEITAAYKTLSDPALRAEYDRVLRLERVTAGKGDKGAEAAFHTGLEELIWRILYVRRWAMGRDYCAGIGGAGVEMRGGSWLPRRI